MHFQAVEESFHYDRHTPLPRGGLDRAMEIKDHLRFGESRRKQIARRPAIHRAARIPHQLAAFIMNRKNHASHQESPSAIVADSEPCGGLPLNPPLLQVRLPVQPQSEGQAGKLLLATASPLSF